MMPFDHDDSSQDLIAVPGRPDLHWRPGTCVANIPISIDLWGEADALEMQPAWPAPKPVLTRRMRPVARLSIPEAIHRRLADEGPEIVSAWVARDALKVRHVAAASGTIEECRHALALLARLIAHDLGEETVLSFDIQSMIPQNAVATLPDGPSFTLPEKFKRTLIAIVYDRHQVSGHCWDFESDDLPCHAPYRMDVAPAAIDRAGAAAALADILADVPTHYGRAAWLSVLEPTQPAEWKPLAEQAPDFEQRLQILRGRADLIFLPEAHSDWNGNLLMDAWGLVAEANGQIGFGIRRRPMIALEWDQIVERYPSRHRFGATIVTRHLPLSRKRRTAITRELSGRSTDPALLQDMLTILASMRRGHWSVSLPAASGGLASDRYSTKSIVLTAPYQHAETDAILRAFGRLLRCARVGPAVGSFRSGIGHPFASHLSVTGIVSDHTGHELLELANTLPGRLGKVSPKAPDLWRLVLEIVQQFGSRPEGSSTSCEPI